MGSLRRTGAALAGCALVVTIGASARPAFAATTAEIRVDQGGYAPGEVKQAYLMTGAKVSGEHYAVLDAHGRTVLTGAVGATSRGKWNAAYPDVYPIDVSALRKTGTYRIKVSGPAAATSPTFAVRSADALYGQLVRDGVTFYQTQRDGKNVIKGALDLKPSHLNDAHAGVYATPTFVTDDIIAEADLTRLGGSTVNVEGGWFDAGDYLKFTHTTAYGAIDLLAAQRALKSEAPAALGAEAQHGIDWLDKMWDQRTKTLYLQVGIGSGNDAGTFLGDHDLWRLPEQDDADTNPDEQYAAAHRPVFEAAAPGALISPNLVGRVSAAFALAAQEERNPAKARADLRAATSLYARADVKSPPNPLVTALPEAFYPEDTWRDDMELGGAEIALAAQRLHVPGAATYVRDAATYAKGYLAHETGDTYNLYDVSALAHTDLIAAMGRTRGFAVSRTQLVADLKRQVQTGATRAATDVFHAGGVYTDFDVDSHTFGLIASEAMYRSVSGDRSYDGYATAQRDWLLGANAWGTSFMVGEGSTFPDCTQHQVANLKGSTDGRRPVLTGAVVNGPNDPSLFEDGLGDYQDGMVACRPDGSDPYAAFNGHGSQFVDDVRAWQTDEPALDMTGAAIIGAALQSAAR